MTTLDILNADIVAELRPGDTDLPALATAKIAAAITHYNRSSFYFNKANRTDIALVIGTSEYTSTAVNGIVLIDDVLLMKTGAVTDLERIDQAEMETLLGAGPSNSTPTMYSYNDQTIYFYPPPDAADTIRVVGQVRLAGPASGAETGNAWMVEAYDLIKARTCWDLTAHTFQGSAGEEAIGYKRAEMEALQALHNETGKRTGTGTLVATEF